MKTGLMVASPLTEFQGRSLDLPSHLALMKSWGVQTLDIFPGFLGGQPAAQVRKCLDDAGVPCACYYIGVDLNAPEAATVAAVDDLFRQGIDDACALGAPIVFTHGTQHSHSGDDMRRRYADRLSEKLPAVRAANLTLVVENAGTLMHTPGQCRWLMEELGPEGLRFCSDTGNFFLWGEDEVESIRELLPWTIHCHVKDYIDQIWHEPGVRPDATNVTVGTGAVRNAECIALLADRCAVAALEPHTIAATEPGTAALAGWIANL
jgi:sugar phosphate isomerase/epimerase